MTTRHSESWFPFSCTSDAISRKKAPIPIFADRQAEDVTAFRHVRKFASGQSSARISGFGSVLQPSPSGVPEADLIKPEIVRRMVDLPALANQETISHMVSFES